ncbi:MAG TPA: alpha-L-fucosidase [Edaphobacter sp.]|nr:alpha-L-fucosidase [Edaphobacter sp.]
MFGGGDIKTMHRSLITLATLLLSPFIHLSPPQVATAPSDSTPGNSTNIRSDERTILMGVDAVRQGGVKPIDMGPGKIGWIESWSSNNDSLTWTALIAKEGKYTISAILESTGVDCAVEVSVDSKRLNASCGKRRWNKVTLGTVQLAAGSRRIQFRSTGSTALGKLFSLELVTPDVEATLARLSQEQASSTDWLVAAKYGLMFHWTSQSKPREGAPKLYCDAVRDFDVSRFADMVSQMGAGFVVFTTSHAGFHFPGPNPAIDAILPGRTCQRDLVRDLAGALGTHNIKLELYFHPGHDDNEWWQRTHFNEDKAAYFDLWCKIISQIGQQYGDQLAGFWFDDAAFTYYPFNAPWRKMTAAAKMGNANRVIAYNSWTLPKLNEFYEVFAGENAFSTEMIDGDDYLPIGGTGRFTGGPQQGLQGQITAIINGDWGHFKTDMAIDPPRYSADVMVAKLKDSMRRRNVPLLDVEVYQDGTISPETFQMFQIVRREIDSTNTQRHDPARGSASQ